MCSGPGPVLEYAKQLLYQVPASVPMNLAIFPLIVYVSKASPPIYAHTSSLLAYSRTSFLTLFLLSPVPLSFPLCWIIPVSRRSNIFFTLKTKIKTLDSTSSSNSLFSPLYIKFLKKVTHTGFSTTSSVCIHSWTYSNQAFVLNLFKSGCHSTYQYLYVAKYRGEYPSNL